MQDAIESAGVVDCLFELDAVLSFTETIVLLLYRFFRLFVRLVDFRRWEHNHQGQYRAPDKV